MPAKHKSRVGLMSSAIWSQGRAAEKTKLHSKGTATHIFHHSHVHTFSASSSLRPTAYLIPHKERNLFNTNKSCYGKFSISSLLKNKYNRDVCSDHGCSCVYCCSFLFQTMMSKIAPETQQSKKYVFKNENSIIEDCFSTIKA